MIDQSQQRVCVKCGGPNDRRVRHAQRAPRYCRDCHAAHMRETRPKHSELPAEAKRKAATRRYTNNLLARGHLVKQPCAKCGSPDVEAHHSDYSDPRNVTWLCELCHDDHHAEHKPTEDS